MDCFRYEIPRYKLELLFTFVLVPLFSILDGFFQGTFVGKIEFLGKYSGSIHKLKKSHLLREGPITKLLGAMISSLLENFVQNLPLIILLIILFKISFLEITIILLIYLFSPFYFIPIIYFFLSLRLLIRKESEVIIETISDFIHTIFQKSLQSCHKFIYSKLQDYLFCLENFLSS